MRKLISVILTTAVLATCLLACKSETYTDKLNDEKKAIEKFIQDNDIDVVYDFPKGAFPENVFYKDRDTGVYIHVINPGSDEKPTKDPVTEVVMRYDTIYNLLNNDVEGIPNWDATYGITFDFGNSGTYTHSSADYTSNYYFQSGGCVLPLEHELGNGAEVKLIVPFENGSLAQLSNYKPYYYSRVKYTFVLDEKED
ncbi:DUF4827 family protein [Dysgonomonas sp. Marseille-P4361]|uniref:DUF4827 family protein n=1 Tax=Dysgonomonas sp. Marseille-P4361 TaxID=2161820 RepID=UPI000D550194|nr:DUF4827 family protein [Dysgonomonas sp. Marseille-P4361]